MKQPIPPRLIETINKLLASPEIGIIVLDRLQMKKVIPFSTNDKIVEDWGGIKEFLEMLHENGHNSIRVIESRKNGTSSKPIDNGTYDLDLGTTQEKPVDNSLSFQPEFTEVQPVKKEMLKAPMDSFGLQAAQMVKAYNYDEVKSERDSYKMKTELLQAEIIKLEKELLRNELGLEAKKIAGESNNELIKTFGPALGAILQAKFAPAQTATTMATEVVGMAAPNVSVTHRQAISNLVTLNDDQAYSMGLIMQSLNGNEPLEADVLAIIEKHNLE